MKAWSWWLTSLAAAERRTGRHPGGPSSSKLLPCSRRTRQLIDCSVRRRQGTHRGLKVTRVTPRGQTSRARPANMTPVGRPARADHRRPPDRRLPLRSRRQSSTERRGIAPTCHLPKQSNTPTPYAAKENVPPGHHRSHAGSASESAAPAIPGRQPHTKSWRISQKTF